MTCDDCTKAAASVWHGFTGGCKGCCARAVSRSPQAFKARSSGDKFDRHYRRLLEVMGVSHNEVVEAHKADFAERSKA
jgi:hypothetical protein